MDNKGRIPGRTIRVEDNLWRAAHSAAKWRGDTVSAVIRRALLQYVRATERKQQEDNTP